jgi:hypothetical protein
MKYNFKKVCYANLDERAFYAIEDGDVCKRNRFNKVTIKERLGHHNRISSESSIQQCWKVQMFQSMKYMTCLISCNNVVALIFLYLELCAVIRYNQHIQDETHPWIIHDSND